MLFRYLRSLLSKGSPERPPSHIEEAAILRKHRERAHRIVLETRRRNEDTARVNLQSTIADYSSNQNDDDSNCTDHSSSDSSCD